MLGSVGVVGLHVALRFADAMPGRDDERTGKHGGLPVDLLRLSIDAAHCADTAFSQAETAPLTARTPRILENRPAVQRSDRECL